MYELKWTKLHVENIGHAGEKTLTIKAPEDGREVTVITESGDERDLYYSSGLWFLPDRSMYVYFVPLFWRYKD